MNMPAWVMLGIVLLFVLLGIYFSRGKGAMLIAGFNTMPKEEQEKYDIKAVCKAMGKLMFALSFSMIFWVVGVATNQMGVFHIGTALFFFIIFVGIVYMNTGDRYKKKSDSH